MIEQLGHRAGRSASTCSSIENRSVGFAFVALSAPRRTSRIGNGALTGGHARLARRDSWRSATFHRRYAARDIHRQAVGAKKPLDETAGTCVDRWAA
jgi:hypothetical protein